MRFALLAVLLAITMSGCASVDFQPYEGKNNSFEGEGGTRLVIDDIEFWANGSPPRKYAVIGVVASEINSGLGDEKFIRSSVAREVKKRGGDAAVEVDNNLTFAAINHKVSGTYTPAGVKRMRFAVVKYIN